MRFSSSKYYKCIIHHSPPHHKPQTLSLAMTRHPHASASLTTDCSNHSPIATALGSDSYSRLRPMYAAQAVCIRSPWIPHAVITDGMGSLDMARIWESTSYTCTELHTHQCAAMEGLLIGESCPLQLRQLQCTSRSSVHWHAFRRRRQEVFNESRQVARSIHCSSTGMMMVSLALGYRS